MIQLSENEKELLHQLAELDPLLAFESLYNIPKDSLLDNECYYPAYYDNSRYCLVWGGRGSGKSREIEGKLPLVLISTLRYCRVLMIRQVKQSIPTTLYLELKDYIEYWKLEDEFEVKSSPMRIISKLTGNEITFDGMDKPDSLKSLKDYTHVFFGEALQIKDEEGVDKVDKSIRTPRFKNHRIYFVFNPDNKAHFLYRNFFDPATEEDFAYYRQNMQSIHTTYRDNKFVPESFVQLLEKDRTANPDRYKVDGLGRWGEIKRMGAYYPNFSLERQTVERLKQSTYNPNAPLHITFDFNVWPYISLVVTQVDFANGAKTVNVNHIEEICLNEKEHGKAAVGSIEQTMKAFCNRYKGHKGTIYYYGDRSGHNRKTNAVSDYATVAKHLKAGPNSYYTKYGCLFKAMDRTNRKNNPSHAARKVFFRRLHTDQLQVLPLSRSNGTLNATGGKRGLSANYGGWTIAQYVDSSCRYLINDYLLTEEDERNGRKDERDKNLTHTSDAVDYFFAMYFDAEFEQIVHQLK